MTQFTHTYQWWRRPMLRVAIMMLLLAGMAAAFSSRQFELGFGEQLKASAWSKPSSHQPVVLWPSTTPITIGDVPNGIVLPSTYSVFNVLSEAFLTVTRPISLPYATYPVFTTPTAWDTTTSAQVYGWTDVPCNQATFSISVNRANKNVNNLRWYYSSTQEISLGNINQLPANGSADEFCIPDPNRQNMYAFRIVGVNSSGAQASDLEAAGVVAFNTNTGAGTLTIAKATVDAPLQAWPPTAIMCGEGCIEQAGIFCPAGLYCKHYNGFMTAGTCVLSECQNQNCMCQPPSGIETE